MLKRTTIFLAVLALLAAACGSDEVAETTTSTAPPTTAAPETTTTTTTTTTAPAETTTTVAVDPIALLAAGMAGTYGGQWRNTTFGSEGPISVTMAVTEDGQMAVTLDVDGFVFGESDPDSEEFSFNIADVTQGATMESAVFGTLTFAVTPLGISVEALDVPSPAIASMSVLATLVEDGIEGTYAIMFDGGGGAEGTFGLTPTG